MGLHPFKIAAIVVALGAWTAVHTAQAVTTATITLGPPIINGNVAQMELSIDFTDTVNANSGVTGFILDLFPSSGDLTDNQSDFSRFSFTPTNLLVNWDPPFLDFDDLGGSAYGIGLDINATTDGLLPAGNPHVVGTLNILLNGLAPGDYDVVIDVQPFSTVFFQPDLFNGTPGTELDIDELVLANDGIQTITIPSGGPAVPEPASVMLAMCGLAALAARRRKA